MFSPGRLLLQLLSSARPGYSHLLPVAPKLSMRLIAQLAEDRERLRHGLLVRPLLPALGEYHRIGVGQCVRAPQEPLSVLALCSGVSFASARLKASSRS
jgi:hypothetical protein